MSIKPLSLAYRPSERLPVLAWAIRMTRGSERIDVYHGSGVETRDDRFFEGAWNGAFPAFDFADATIVAGTGAVLTPDGLLARSSSDRISPLFSVQRRDQRVISNSPVFAISLAGDAPRDAYPFHAYHFLQVWRDGLAGRGGRLRLKHGGRLAAHAGSSVLLDAQGNLTVRAPPAVPAPRDFAEYESLLTDGVRAIAENARHPARRRSYELLAALSTGYDSSATAALAAEAGCKDALTFRDDSRPDPRADSGLENAPYLGMTAIEYNRDDYRKYPGRLLEAEFVVASLSTSVPLASAENTLAGRVLVAGSAAGNVWMPERAAVAVNNRWPWLRSPLGVGQLEFRLRVDYMVFAPVGIASEHGPALARISRSVEMRPWTVGGDYDRPIPRRLAESRGLPRGAFGTRKYASGHRRLVDPGNYTPHSRETYESYVRELHASIPRIQLAYWRAAVAIRHRLWKAFGSRERRYVPMNRIQRMFPFLANSYPRPIPWTYMFTCQWAFKVLKDRYTVEP